MGYLSEFFIATASQNNFGSISSQIAMAIANSIPVLTSTEDFSGAEEKAANQQQMIREAIENKQNQEHLLSQISIVRLNQHQSIYSLEETFNVIVDGEIFDNDTGRRLTRFDVLSDFPIQVNALDYAKPLNILTS